MNNRFFDNAKRIIRLAISKETDPKIKKDLQDAITDINSGIIVEHRKQQDAKMIGIRNPSFDGDYVGFPEDDFDDDEDDSGQKNKKR
jgi:hypothetical protein